MKRVIIAFIMLAVTVISIALITIKLDNLIKKTDSRVLYLYSNIENMTSEETEENIKLLIEDWNKTEKILKFVSNHDRIDPVSENIGNLEGSDKKELKKQCAKIKLQLEMLLDSEKPLAENIF